MFLANMAEFLRDERELDTLTSSAVDSASKGLELLVDGPPPRLPSGGEDCRGLSYILFSVVAQRMRTHHEGVRWG